MKKWFLAVICVFLLAGCSIGKDMTNTPTKKVEAYMDGYQKLDDNVLNDIDTLLHDTEYTVEQKSRYKELMKKHYKDINYEIKEEKVNGDKATVEVEVEVRDYSKILSSDVIPDEIKDEEAKKYIDNVVLGIESNKEQILKYIEQNLKDEWKLNRISKMDL